MVVVEVEAEHLVDVSPSAWTGGTAAARARWPWALPATLDFAALAGAAAMVQLEAATVAYLLVTFATLALTGTYRRRITLSMLDEAPRLALPMACALLIVGLPAIVVHPPSSLFAQALLSTLGVLAGRSISYSMIRAARRRGRLAEPTVIVGAGSIGVELHEHLARNPDYGLRPLGIVDDVPATEGSLPLIGGIDDLPSLVTMHRLRCVIVAFGLSGEHEIVTTLRAVSQLDVDVHVVPRFYELGLPPPMRDFDQIWGVPLYRLRRAALREVTWKAKRVADAVLAAVALATLAPLLAVLALMVLLSSRGPVLYTQVRVGQNGRTIKLLKFRTLPVDVDADLTWSVDDDPRVTRVGKWLRRLSLDELPQLWNILRGDMSLVGPRPERPLFVDHFSSSVVGYDDRHRLPVGLTGLAQVHGLRGDTSIEERARFDNLYIEQWSPWSDVKILLRTIRAALRHAYRGRGANVIIDDRRLSPLPVDEGERLSGEPTPSRGVPPASER